MDASSLATQVKDFRTPRQAILRIDPWLMLATVGLLVCSGFVLYGATNTDIPGQPYHYVDRQIAYGVVGLVFMLLLSRFDYSRTRDWSAGMYVFLIFSILAVFALGGVTRGSKRWINLPFFNFQPSELGKVLLTLALSAYIVDHVRRLQDKETTVRVMLLALLPALMVIVQPDLGSAFVYMTIAATLLLVAGTKWTHFAVLGTLAVTAVVVVMVAAPRAGVHILKPYQMDRLTAFLHPTDNPRKQGYQLNQSVTAIGAGQKTGRGNQATQTKLNFLPEHHTDFVFSVVGEEYGFVGAAVVLSLFALLIWRSLRILTMAKNLYGMLIAAGITAMLMFQVFVNVGMTVGIMPITGVPLPLMSYGGSSVIVTLVALGLLQSVHAQARELAAGKGRDQLL